MYIRRVQKHAGWAMLGLVALWLGGCDFLADEQKIEEKGPMTEEERIAHTQPSDNKQNAWILERLGAPKELVSTYKRFNLAAILGDVKAQWDMESATVRDRVSYDTYKSYALYMGKKGFDRFVAIKVTEQSDNKFVVMTRFEKPSTKGKKTAELRSKDYAIVMQIWINVDGEWRYRNSHLALRN